MDVAEARGDIVVPVAVEVAADARRLAVVETGGGRRHGVAVEANNAAASGRDDP